MLSFTTVIVLILLAIGVWLWSANTRAREVAIQAVKQACSEQGVQLLDGTTHFNTCKLRRNLNGKLGIIRFYHFEYFDGILRHRGTASVFALKINSIEFENMENLTTKQTTNTNNVIQFPTKSTTRKNH